MFRNSFLTAQILSAASNFVFMKRHIGWRVACNGSIIAGTTGLLFFADQPVRSFAERNHSILNDDVLNITEKYGVTENAILLSGSI